MRLVLWFESFCWISYYSGCLWSHLWCHFDYLLYFCILVLVVLDGKFLLYYLFLFFVLEISVNFNCGHDVICDVIIFLDFDRRVKFWFALESKSIDFTCVLLDWWVVNRLVLMCYFLIKYGIFGWVREKLYFSRVWGCFCGIVVIFGVVGMGENGVKWSFCRTHYRTRKWGFRRENNRYAVPDFRLHVLKCKPRPLYGIKRYYNSTVLLYLCSWSVV